MRHSSPVVLRRRPPRSVGLRSRKLTVARATLLAGAIAGLVAGALAACGGEGATASSSSPPSAGGGPVPSFGGQPAGGAGAPSPTNPAATCTGGGGPIPQTPFTGALCACRNVNVQGYLRTRAVSSLQVPPPPGGAAVGVDNDYVVVADGANAGDTDIGGSFAVAGSASAFAGFLSVTGDLGVGSGLDVAGYTRVTRDAWINGDFRNAGFAQIGRDLHIAGADFLPASVAGKRSHAPVSINPPCACDPPQLIDVPGLVAAARVTNDNATVHLDSKVWANAVGDPELTLPSGRYYLDAIGGIGNVVLHVNGQVALYVGGDVTPIGRFAIDLASGASTIDLFVGGAVRLTGYSPLGDKSRPYATRIYTTAAEELDLTGYEDLVGNLYAPRARVSSKGFLNVWGSMFVGDLEIAGFANFVYDLAVIGGGGNGGGCTPLPVPDAGGPCGPFTCPQGQACIAGQCGACKQDSDCAGSLVCDHGACVPLIK